MTGGTEMFKALPNAFGMTLLPTGNVDAAVLDGIAPLELDRIPGDSLLPAAGKSATHRRVAVPERSEALSLPPAELRCLFLLASNYRDYFMPCVETWDITRCNSVPPAHGATADPCTSTSGVSPWPPAR
jgi:hypothetical protein